MGYSPSPQRALQYQQLLSPVSDLKDGICESPCMVTPIAGDGSSPDFFGGGQGSMDSQDDAESPIQFQILLEGSCVTPVLLRQASNEVRRPRTPRLPRIEIGPEPVSNLAPSLIAIPASRSPSPSLLPPVRLHSPALSLPDMPKPLRISTEMRRATAVQLSPAALKMLASDVPTVSILPSLDGSQYSDLHATSETPPTPIINNSLQGTLDWQNEALPLDFAALQTLQVLPGDYHATSPVDAVQSAQLPAFGFRLPTPPSHDEALGDTQLEDVQSSLAETFYRRPWEDVTEIESFQKAWDFYSSVPTSTPSPAPEVVTRQLRPRPYPFRQDSLPWKEAEKVHTGATEPSGDLPRLLPLPQVEQVDRTSTWLLQQTSLLANLRTPSPPTTAPQTQTPPPVATSPSQGSSPGSHKKSVRFSNNVQTTVIKEEPIDLETIVVMRESAMYRAFQQLSKTAKRRDAFIQGIARSDSVHTDRLTRRAGHIRKLSAGSPTYRKQLPKAGSPITKADAERFEQVDIEEAIEQLNPSRWEVEASNYIHKKKLLISPSGAQLRKGTRTSLKPKQQQVVGGTTNAPSPPAKKQKARILDLGGEAYGWGWHCAEAFPNANVYTVVPRTPIASPTSSDSASPPVPTAPAPPKPKGPPNHRVVPVEHLHKLPFGESKFDVISARSLHQLLRLRPATTAAATADSTSLPSTTPSDPLDEWDATLTECMRVLRPGGHLEFHILDAEVTNPGPAGRRMNSAFSRLARGKGFDTCPGRRFVGRLGRCGFRGVRRCWMVLPAAQQLPEMEGEGEGVEGMGEMGEAVVAGAGVGAVGPGVEGEGDTRSSSQLTGMVGARAWERWLVGMQKEDGRGEGRLLGEVGPFMEEAARVGSGWRYLTGYARKPRAKSVVGGVV